MGKQISVYFSIRFHYSLENFDVQIFSIDRNEDDNKREIITNTNVIHICLRLLSIRIGFISTRIIRRKAISNRWLPHKFS